MKEFGVENAGAFGVESNQRRHKGIFPTGREPRMRGLQMNRGNLAYVSAAVFVLFIFTSITPIGAQTNAATLSGKITDTSGAAIANAQVSIKNVATGQVSAAQTDETGAYSIANLAPGDYEVSISAGGFNTAESKVTLAAGATQVLNMSLSAALSLQDLGISSTQTQGNPKEQARLNKRSHMLKIHQELGLITVAPLVATVVSGAFAGGKATSTTDRDLHAALGSTTAGLYFTSAYFAIFAPKIHGTKTEGNIKLHKALALIHGPGMILTPMLGEMAFSQRSQGERVHGIARAHGQVAIVTAGAYGLAILSVSLRSGPAKHDIHHALGIFGGHHSPETMTLTDSRAQAELVAEAAVNSNGEKKH